MRVLVTGAAGFLGSTLVDRLLLEGHAVLGLDDLSQGRLDNLAAARAAGGVQFSRFDVTGQGLVELLGRDVPEVAICLAGRSRARPRSAAEVQVLGGLGVLEASRAAGVRRVIVASGSAVYGAPARVPVTERAALAPTSPTGASLVAAEAYLAAYSGTPGLAGVALRFPAVYGPRSQPGSDLVATWTTALLAGRPTTIFGNGSATDDYLYVDDAVEAILACLGGAADGRRLNIGTGIATAKRDLHAGLAAATDRPDAPGYAPGFGGPEAMSLDASAARRLLGWEPKVGLADGLARTVAASRARLST